MYLIIHFYLKHVLISLVRTRPNWLIGFFFLPFFYFLVIFTRITECLLYVWGTVRSIYRKVDIWAYLPKEFLYKKGDYIKFHFHKHP